MRALFCSLLGLALFFLIAVEVVVVLVMFAATR